MRAASPRSRRLLATTTALAVTVASVVLGGPAASAAVSFTVSTTADIAANAGACGNSGITTAPSPLSLREASCLANNVGGTVTINIPAGTYNLANGELQPGIAPGANVSLVGAGAASTVINAGGLSRVFDLDANLTGGISNTISGVTVTGGADSTFGGAGIIGGSNLNSTADSLTLNNVIVTGNVANASDPTATNKVGGGIQFLGGQLTISNSTISNNSAKSSFGSGVAYGANGDASPEGLSITNTTFSGNSSVNTSGDSTQNGGALALFGTPTSNFSVTGSRFVNNTATSSSGSGAPVGAAIWQQSGNLTVTGSTFSGNSVSGGPTPSGGAINVTSGTAALHFNRFIGNTASSGGAVAAGVTVNATQNWWGCNGGPGTTGCDTTAGTVTAVPRLVLSATASPSTVVGPNATSTITAALNTDSAGSAVSGANLGAFQALPVTFANPTSGFAVLVGSHTVPLNAGLASIGYQSTNHPGGVDHISATFDNATPVANLEVDHAPAITSASTVTFTVGTAGPAFTVTTSGYPAPAITRTGTLPPGLTFTDNGNGTATLTGTPTGSGGSFPIALTANNGVGSNATQTLTITVLKSPAFTSPAASTFTVGSPGSFTVTTSGVPTVTTITESGTLPPGVTFTDNGDGTATLAGTPTGSGATYPVTLTGTNGVTPNASQVLTIQVNQAPSITLNPSNQTVQPGTSVTFSAAASGVPTPTVQWQRSTNGGASFTNIAGATSTSYTFTTAIGDNGNQYRAVFTNSVNSATTTAATLGVGTAPAFTSANHTTFAVGSAGSIAITTSGIPSATISRSGAQFPAWATLTDNGDGTGTLTGTPPTGSGGTYVFVLHAANGFSPAATQTFTLDVDESPIITSANHATFTTGVAGAFSVTTSAGHPTTTTLTKTGSLPSGVTFTDNGDGTATLAGTPAPGTGGAYAFTITATAVGSSTTARTQSFTLTVNQPPTITSTNHATFAVGSAGSFTVTTTAGNPTATTLTKTGTLPTGVTFTDNGDGTATLAGTAAVGTGGTYAVTVKASNGVSPDASQTFTLTVDESPVFTSVDHVTFTTGVVGSFDVTTSAGHPSTTTLTKTGNLPAGVTFTDNGDGTATLAGTPAPGTGGDHPFTITATAVGSSTTARTQSFTLTVNEPPTITSVDGTTFAVGSAGSFTVTTTAGSPAATTLSQTGGLPTGVTFEDNGDGTATLAGTAAVGTGGIYELTVKASNGVAPDATQAFTLVVDESPVFTSVDHVTFTTGVAGSFDVTTSAGHPTSTTLTKTGNLPAGVTFTDNGDGTASLSGTPAAGTGGSYPLTITATAVGSSTTARTQSFTLTVDEPPIISSADHATFAVGSAGSFTVTTTAGTPTATTISRTGGLPTGVTFEDNGDGTATLAGTPAAGTSGSYVLTLKASNGVDPDASQTFTLTVTEVPQFTSDDATTMHSGQSGSFTVTTTPGFPASTSLTEVGALPAGVTFVDNGDGTATLAGTPDPGTGGSYPLTLTATNTAGHVDQAFDLSVSEATGFTSADSTTLTVGAAGSFTITTNGVPDAAISSASALPSGVTLVDNNDGTATLAGTPDADTGGVYLLDITAANGEVPDATQQFTLTVEEAPEFTSAASASFASGVAGTFTVTTRGYPAPPITETGTIPAGVTLVDNGDGTATLAGTPDAGTAGDYPITLGATNGIGSAASQDFVLQVTTGAQTIVFTSTAPTDAVVGSTYDVAATGGASGNPVTFTIDPATSANCTIASDTVTFVHPGTCTVDAAQEGDAQYSPATAAQTIAVGKASTSTHVVVDPTSITATVAAVAPGAGTPTGDVTFSVDATVVGHATLSSGQATLSYTVPDGQSRAVSAEYAGDSDFMASSDSTARHDPTITATVTSTTAKTAYGWYRSPVRIAFTCTTNGSPLTAPCPSAVTLIANGAGRSVTRTIEATDGGMATVTVGNINIDKTAPKLRIRGVKKGATYLGKPPKAICVGTDALSGVASCKVTKVKHGKTVTVTGRVVDRAGNVTTKQKKFTVLRIYVQGAVYRNGAFKLREGHSYTVVTLTKKKAHPRYYDASPKGHPVGGADAYFHKAGKQTGLHRYTLSIHIASGLSRRYSLWNFGVKFHKVMHRVVFRPKR